MLNKMALVPANLDKFDSTSVPNSERERPSNDIRKVFSMI